MHIPLFCSVHGLVTKNYAWACNSCHDENAVMLFVFNTP